MDVQLIAFCGVALGLVAMPGADFAVVVRSALVSRREGAACAAGIAAGLLVHTALAVAGVAAVLAAEPALFRALQVAGGAYILYLGIQALRSAARMRAVRAAETPETAPSGGVAAEGVDGRPVRSGSGSASASGVRALREGFLTNVLNPKAALTFLGVLPQFVPAGSPAMPRTLVLGAIVVTVAALWFQGVALLVDRIGRRLRRPSTARRIEGVTGAALAAMGLGLLVTPLVAG
ncbi:LysE family translocator [Streptomyces sp. NPDC002851]